MLSPAPAPGVELPEAALPLEPWQIAIMGGVPTAWPLPTVTSVPTVAKFQKRAVHRMSPKPGTIVVTSPPPPPGPTWRTMLVRAKPDVVDWRVAAFRW
jgi:hypothetical protein